MTRSRLDLLAHILETARNGTTKDRIASQAGGHQEMINYSLSLLRDLNLLIETRNSPVSFVATQKGLQFLHDYEQLTKQLISEERRK